MRHTTARSLVISAVVGGVLLWGIEVLLVTLGEPVLVPPQTWSIALVVLGGAIMALAWPIRAHARSTDRKGLMDPFYATRVVLLAKSMALGGAVLTGGAIGALLFLGTRPVVPAAGLWLSGAAVVGAIVLMTGGVIAERWCTLPPGSSTGDPEGEPEGGVR